MKSVAIAAIVAIAATPLAAAHGNMCDATKIATAFPAAEQAKCKTESGFDLTATTPPTEAILAKFCKSETCLGLWKSAKAIALPECAINGKDLNEDILDPVEAACKKAAGGSGSDHDSHDDASHDVATNNTTTKATTAPISNSTASKTPSASNSTASKTPSASNSTSSKTPSTTTAAKAPSTTTAAKTPSPTTSSASTLTMAAGAVLLTIAAAMF